MAEVFGVRSLIYWWGMLTATAFIKDWMTSLAKLLEDPATFAPDKVPFNILPGLNQWIHDVAEYVRESIKFDAAEPIATIGTVSIPGWVLALILGLVLLGTGVRVYRHALKSSLFFDDFVALVILYIIVRFEGHILALTVLPLQGWFKALGDNQAISFFIMMILMLSWIFIGEGVRSRHAFWRALIEAVLVALFIYPRETANILGHMVEGLATFGASLTNQANLPFTIAWGVIGMVLAIQRLTGPEPGKAQG